MQSNRKNNFEPLKDDMTSKGHDRQRTIRLQAKKQRSILTTWYPTRNEEKIKLTAILQKKAINQQTNRVYFHHDQNFFFCTFPCCTGLTVWIPDVEGFFDRKIGHDLHL